MGALIKRHIYYLAALGLAAVFCAEVRAAQPATAPATWPPALPAAMVISPMTGPAPKLLYGDVSPVRSAESLKNVVIANTTIESSILATDGSCRVIAVVTHPPADDQVRMLIALPTKGWNGRFCGTGGGGFIGGMPLALFAPLAQGYVAAKTDTGHTKFDGSFALDAKGRLNWQAIVDNAYLGIHDMTVVGKALTAAFYGKPARYCYFAGFSTGGRQGLMEAQRYPEDYDGIICGCPAINLTRMVMAELWPGVVERASGDFLSPGKFQAVTAAAIKNCAAKGGVVDGVIDDPSRSDYDPGALVGTKIGDETFTQTDADVVRKIWDGPRAADGGFLWYGLERGASLSMLAGPRPFLIPVDWVRYFLLQDPKWSVSELTPGEYERLFGQSVEEYGAIFATDDADLTRFRGHGGKIIISHGLVDQLIMTRGTIDYYDRVVKQMGGREKVGQFARLFLIPGAGHGLGGVVDYDAAIVRWVEEGTPPETLTARRETKDGVAMRLLYPYR